MAGLLGCTTHHPGDRGRREGDGFAQPPHVVLLILDTLRADRLGMYGFTQETSPGLDRLAAAGVRFETVIAPSSWTRPSVASIVTGQHPRRLGIHTEREDALPPEAVLLSEALQAEGYATFGATANPNLNRAFGFAQGFDTYLDSDVVFSWMPHHDDEHTDVSAALHDAATLLGHARDFAAAHPHQPVYLQVDLMEVHEWLRGDAALTRPEHQGRFSGTEGPYLDAISQLSEDIPAFIASLQALPGWERSLFVLTSDHGEGLQSHLGVPDAMGHGRYLYSSMVTVPLVLYAPGGQLGRGVIRAPARLQDLAPTVLDLAGLSGGLRWDAHSGRSWAGSIVQHTESPYSAEPQLLETRFRGVHRVGLFDEHWLYIEDRLAGTAELQAARSPQVGPATDRCATHTEACTAWARRLHAWEARIPAEAAWHPAESASPDQLDQLRALGYIE